MRKVEILGFGYYVPETTVVFGGQTRHRVKKNSGETQITMAATAARRALEKAHVDIKDIELIVSSSAVQVQPIPCTAALIHEQIAKGLDIPAMDICTTCTSFLTAFDTISYLIEGGRYKKVLLVSSEMASVGLNPDQKESFELFGDGAVAVVLAATDSDCGVICAKQKTWSEGAHDTEIRGGLTNLIPSNYTPELHGEFEFDMNGVKVLSLAAKKLPPMFKDFLSEAGMTMDDISMVVPHQASRALGPIMKRIGVGVGKYIDIVSDYGNMVSVAIPHAFMYGVENGLIKKGDTVLLMGTAAGLTANMLLIKY